MPPMVSESKLQSMRQFREENMLFRCDIEEMLPTPVSDGTGGFIEDWQTIAGLTDLPCSAVAMSGDETTAAQQVAPASNTWIYLPWRYGPHIKAKYRIVVRGEIDGVAFVETYGIVYIAVPKTFSVQTTIFARSGMASSGEPRMALRAGVAPVASAPAMGLGNTSPMPIPGVVAGLTGFQYPKD